MNGPARGDLFIVSSPSGGGKTTLIRSLLAKQADSIDQGAGSLRFLQRGIQIVMAGVILSVAYDKEDFLIQIAPLEMIQ